MLEGNYPERTLSNLALHCIRSERKRKPCRPSIHGGAQLHERSEVEQGGAEDAESTHIIDRG